MFLSFSLFSFKYPPHSFYGFSLYILYLLARLYSLIISGFQVGVDPLFSLWLAFFWGSSIWIWSLASFLMWQMIPFLSTIYFFYSIFSLSY